MVWEIALNVWLLLVGLSWWGQITASSKFLGICAIIVVIIYVVELVWGASPGIRKRFNRPAAPVA